MHTHTHATSHAQVAKKDNLNAIQIELRKLEQSMHDIHVELQLIRRKEVGRGGVRRRVRGWVCMNVCEGRFH